MRRVSAERSASIQPVEAAKSTAFWIALRSPWISSGLRATGGWQAAFGSELRVSVHFADGEARAEAAATERDGATATAMNTSTDAGGASASAAVPQTSANPAGRDARPDTQHRR